MLEDVRRVVQAVREVVESEDVKQLFTSARRAADQLDETLRDARSALTAAHTLVERLDTEVGSVSEESRATLRELRGRLAKAEETLDMLEANLRGADEARMDVSRTLDEMQQAMAALRNLVDYIQTHPEAVIQGKEPEKENR